MSSWLGHPWRFSFSPGVSRCSDVFGVNCVTGFSEVNDVFRVASVSGYSQVRVASVSGYSQVRFAEVSGYSQVRFAEVSGCSRIRFAEVSGYSQVNYVFLVNDELCRDPVDCLPATFNRSQPLQQRFLIVGTLLR